MMMGNSPAWYMTTQEFADQVVQLLAEQNYFKRGEPAHPEDIVIAFTSTAESFARGAGFIGKKVSESQRIIRK
jgi:hypothetical protein